ncbi:MAG: hypothetical protein H6737_12650 [Alphaproteobacteria bacterium]|nr:hypothetical protein [Alphaproteobacteria bacterium]
MIALVTLSALAKADVAFVCDLSTLTATVPAADATDVPVDLAPLFLWEGDCGIDTPVTVTLSRAGEIGPVFTQDFEFGAFTSNGATWMLEPDWGTLDADTVYTVEITNPYGEATLFGFTTGSRTAESIAGGAPGVVIDDARQAKLNRWTHPIEVDLTLTSAGESGGVFVLRDGGTAVGVAITDAPTGTATVTWTVGEREREVCITAVQRDETGAWHGPSDETCAKLQGARGCSHTAPFALGWLAMPLLLGLRRAR